MLNTNTIDWLIGLQVGDSVGVFCCCKLLYKTKIKAKFSDMFILDNNTQFDEYGDEIQLSFREDNNKQYIGPI